MLEDVVLYIILYLLKVVTELLAVLYTKYKYKKLALSQGANRGSRDGTLGEDCVSQF